MANFNQTEFPGADFTVDYAAHLSAYELIAQMPHKDWRAGLPLGNGDLCALAWQPGGPGGLSWGLTKTDVWDLRSPYKNNPQTPHAEIMRLIEQEDWKSLHDIGLQEHAAAGSRKDPPNFKPCGILSLNIPEMTQHLHMALDSTGIPRSSGGRSVLRDYEARLSLHRAQLQLDIQNRFMKSQTTSFVHAARNVMVLRFRDIPTAGYDLPRALRTEYVYDHPQIRSVTLLRQTDPTLGTPDCGSDGRDFWVEYPFPEGIRYVMMARVLDSSHSIERCEDGWIATLDELDAPELTVLGTVVTSFEGEDVIQAAHEKLDAAESSGIDNLERTHVDWWEDFWSRSFVSISDPFLSHLWHHSLYLQAASHQGRYPPPIQTPWNLDEDQQLHGNYHGDINIQQTLWPTFSSNHQNLAKPFLQLYGSCLDQLREDTKKIYGMDGVRYPVMTTPNMVDRAHLWPRYWMGMSAWFASIFWENFRYTQDVEWLKEAGFPVLKGVAEFYEEYLQQDDEGTFHIYPTHSPEQGAMWVRDATIDLAFIKVALKATIEASEILDVESEERSQWQNILDNLPEYPQNDEVLLDYEGAPPDLPLGHISLLAPIFPAGDIGLDSSPETFAQAKRTFESVLDRSNRHVPFFPYDSPTIGDNTNWMWLAGVAARLGLGETARGYLYDLGIFPHLKHNGTFFNGYALNLHDRDDGTAYGHANWAFAGAMNEMLLQSYNDRIRVFPAVPGEWSVAFARMRATGAFLVTSEYKQGVIPYITVESEVGNTCSVVSPWEKTKLYDLTADESVLTTTDPVVTWPTTREHVYRLNDPENSDQSSERRILSGKRQRQPRVYWGPDFLADSGENRRSPVYLGKPKQWVPLPPGTVHEREGR